ncbi:uncharacterized protein LAESUDRAFT_757454 [Laetiporus sulphureus 93-53]|uniref:Condensation domain-containing protein n=1 Tax=Laetiporus sulphureus 93-53 TaxID=1314785 RepID=A0A165FC14_9APHY|nr:uncharacterized protein LAESUDRAFT_757454 [Laetiporus sulphureus 93-53]KZT08741.1 hypothetical protein LAESUDRAFT_757454 [Laetiporus sulphureus 93-53]
MQNTAHLADSSLSCSRALGATERSWLAERGVHGYTDFFTIIQLVCPSGPPIDDSEIIHAYALLRLRHPPLASRLSHSGSVPEFEYKSPQTEARALQEAAAHVEFGTFEDRDAAVVALRTRWLSIDRHHVLDVRASMSSIFWMRSARASVRQYVLGLRTAHFVADIRRQLGIMREFVELLSSSGQLKAEIRVHLKTSRPGSMLPPPLETRIPDIASSSVEELKKGEDAFLKWMEPMPVPTCGLVPDGTADENKYDGRVLRHILSRQDTARIARACRANGTSITQMVLAAIAIAGVSADPSHPSVTAKDALFSNITLPMDLSPHIRSSSVNRDNLVILTRMYPMLMRVPRFIDSSAPDYRAVWRVAQECKQRYEAFVRSPYFWHLSWHGDRYTSAWNTPTVGEPFLPMLSSLGDCSKLLPLSYSRAANGCEAADPRSRELSIRDMETGGKINTIFGLWTFDGRLNMQLTYNGARISSGIVEPYLRRVVDVVMRVGLTSLREENLSAARL